MSKGWFTEKLKEFKKEFGKEATRVWLTRNQTELMRGDTTSWPGWEEDRIKVLGSENPPRIQGLEVVSITSPDFRLA